jgi:hypothetical protein
VEQVLPRLYIGNDNAYERVAKHSGWSWLRCCKDGPGGHRDILGYRTLGAPKDKNYLWVRRGKLLALNLLDLDDPGFIADDMIQTGMDFIHERLQAGDKVLASCNQGHSRSPATVLMYLRTIGEMPQSFIQSERKFRTLYPPYDPSDGIRQFARSHWGQLEDLRTNA